MRNLLILIIIILSFSLFSCEKNTSPLHEIPSEITLREITSSDDSHIADSIRSLYRTDAARLALNHVYQNKLPDTASVNIPQQLIDSFYSGLIHIYNCTTITSVDTITKIRPVHTLPYVSLYHIWVHVDTSYNWTKQWENGFTFTGNDAIDSLLIEYELELGSYSFYPDVSLKTHKPLNMRTLGKIFEKISGVIFAVPDVLVGSGDDLEANLESLWIRYIFSFGWGDCPAGCIHRRFWEYTVSDSGEVRYWGSYGDKLYIK